ncbi:uncharacterized protein [Prorops nasuta]|uniref:uncharacterized protein n=1 Tax=Prorops nasuta TaxID=863751 RepID=UPI0034CFEB1B
MGKILKGRLSERRYRLYRVRSRKSINNDLSLVEEKWCRKRQYKNKYFKSTKNIHIKEDSSNKLTDDPLILPTKSVENYMNTEDETNSELIDDPLPLQSDLMKPDNLLPDTVTAVNFLSADSSYPQGFPALYKNIGNIIVNEDSFRSLQANSYVDDAVINSFGVICQDMLGNNNRVIIFDTFLVSKIILGTISQGYEKLLGSQSITDALLWIAPVFDDNKKHWTLLIINFKDKLIIFLDSLHSSPPKNLINNMCSLMDELYKNQKFDVLNWSEWLYHIPKDIPMQCRKNGSISSNCGVHLCWYIYSICSGNYIIFNDDDMDNFRKSIAKLIIEHVDKPVVRQKRVKIFEQIASLHGDEKEKKYNLRGTKKPPQNWINTLLYCATIKDRLIQN